MKTLDPDGWYTTDAQGRRPGLYTYLGGKANYWPKEQVDFNLRKLPSSNAFVVGGFDKLSIMKYYFDPTMFSAGDKSPCYTGAENLQISALDKAGVASVYSSDPGIQKAALLEQIQSTQDMSKSATASPELKRNLSLRLQQSLAQATH